MRTNLDRMWAHIAWLASEPRPAESERLEQCRQYCQRELTASGWQISRRVFKAGGEDGLSWTGVNLIARHSENFTPDDRSVFVLGAHLDSRPETPGADDNASAVAVLLEVARCLEPSELRRSSVALELVLFDLEELGMLGGACHANDALEGRRDLVGMVSLEMLGYCDPTPGSQHLPQELEGRYPDTGDFIGIVGNQNSDVLLKRFEAGMKRIAGLPVHSLQVADNGLLLPPTRLSDHSPFWDLGFSALMITDTSFMRNPHYHQSTDTLETLNQEFLHCVAEGVLESVRLVCKR